MFSNIKKILTSGRKCWLIFLLFLFTLKLSAQTDSLRCLSMTASNDLFDGTNRYFTSGLTFSYIDYRFEDSFLVPILFKLKYLSSVYYGVGLTQNLFTPNDIYSSKYNPSDRPYTATLTVSAFCISNYRRAKIRLTSLAQIGVIGKDALGKELQDEFNIGNTSGWNHQLSNAPIVNYSATIEKGYINNPRFELMSKSQAEVGTLYINVKGGFKLRAGIFTPYFKKHEDAKGDFQLYFDAETLMKLVFYDATLTGSFFTDNQYGLKYENINKVIFEQNISLVASYQKIRINITQHILPPEFINAYWDKWVSIKFGYAF